MAEEVREFLKKKDYYEILGVPRSANDADLKKAYRQLAIKFHPDKNKNPGAQDAFKKIAQAYSCLSDAEKRRRYDQVGTEEQVQQPQYRQYQYQYADDDFAQVLNYSKKNLFDAFFGPQMRRGHANGNGHARHPQQLNLNLLQLLPILIIILFSSNFLSLFEKQPLFSFHKTLAYNMKRTTKTLQVMYFVGEKFKSEIDEGNKYELDKFEMQVEQTYVNQLKSECNNAINRRDQLQFYQSRSLYQSDRNNYQRAIDRLDFSFCHQITTYRDKIKNFDKLY